jgi:hypothetical protein
MDKAHHPLPDRSCAVVLMDSPNLRRRTGAAGVATVEVQFKTFNIHSGGIRCPVPPCVTFEAA